MNDKHRAVVLFREADRLYRREKYLTALEILEELDGLFPDDRNVLFPKARCLAKLERMDEAYDLCEEIIEKFDYARAHELRALILKSRSTPGFVIPVLDLEYESDEEDDSVFSFLEESPWGDDATPVRGGSKKVWLLLFFGVVVVGVVLYFVFWG